MARRELALSDKTRKVGIFMESDMLKASAVYAAEHAISRSYLIDMALRHAIAIGLVPDPVPPEPEPVSEPEPTHLAVLPFYDDGLFAMTLHGRLVLVPEDDIEAAHDNGAIHVTTFTNTRQLDEWLMERAAARGVNADVLAGDAINTERLAELLGYMIVTES